MTEHFQPIVSVILPTFNRARTLTRAIRSVLAQTFQEWELLVVDDASIDETSNLMRKFSDARIRYIRHEHNRGPSSARNSGIEVARGAYIAFLDSDDEWFPEKLADDISVFGLDGEGVGLVYSGEIALDAGGRNVMSLPEIQGRAYENLLAHDFIGGCSRVTVRANALEIVGRFDEQLANEEDWDLWLRIAKVFVIKFVRKYAVKHYVGHNQITNTTGSLRRIYEGRALIIGKHRDQMQPGLLAKHLADQAGLLLNYDIHRARELAFESLKLKVLQPRLVGALVGSLLGIRAYRKLFSQWVILRHSHYMGRARV